MRVLVQRVKEAKVTVSGVVCGSIGQGLLLFLGVHKEDTPAHTDWLVNKILGLRIFADADGKMNLDIRQTGGDLLVVSQFTLYGTLLNGKRPEFTEAALPEPAFLLYEQFIQELSQGLNKPIQTGIFGAIMEVSSVNDGPVTLLLETAVELNGRISR